ncbi:MAG: peptide ABC transporter substrate-binding protein [Treponema sp.]|jgi:oligopeptide transport system substrate-binding protein|nr:peptide ABC transporter substrate-binding protein [Treponema sp.]
MKKNLLPVLILTVALAGPVFAGGFKQQSGPAAAASGVKKISLYTEREYRSLNQLTGSDQNLFEVLGNVSEGLYRTDADHQPVPALATGHEVSPDGLVYTFHLRRGLKWSNGDPLTAKDFVYSCLKLVENPENSYGFIVTDYVVNAMEYQEGKVKADQVGLKALNDLTFQVTLKAPTAYFILLTTMPVYYPLNEKFVESRGGNYANTAQDILYCGPFKITEFDLASGVKMVKNPDYWDAASVKLDAVEFHVIKDQSAALNAYEAGEIDRVNLTAQDIPSFKNSPDVITFSDFRNNYLQFNTINPEMNLNIRKALSFAVDRELLVSTVLANGSVAAGGVVSQGVNGDGKKTFRQLNGNVSAFDAAKAKQHWAVGVAELGGKAPQLTMLCMDDSMTKDLATFVQDQCRRNLGIEVTISPSTQRARNDVMQTNPEYDFAISAWGADYDDAMTYLDLWTSGNGYRGNYSNPDYNKMIADAKAEPDPAKRLAIMLRAEKKLIEEDMVVTGIYDRGFTRLTRKNVKGLIAHPVGQPLDLKWAYVE